LDTDTDTIDTALSGGTFTAATYGATSGQHTAITFGAWCIVVDLAIAIVVDTVADLRFGVWCEASKPSAIDTVFNALTTGSATTALDIIDDTVAIVVFAVADLWFGLRS
jgi:hypothetical protein